MSTVNIYTLEANQHKVPFGLMLTLTDLKMVVHKTAYKAWRLDFQRMFMMKQCVNTMSISIFQNQLLDVPEELDCKGRCNALQLSRTSLVATRQA